MDQNQWNATPEGTEQSAPEQNTANNNFYAQPGPEHPHTSPRGAEVNAYAIASLILRVVSIVLCCCSCLSIVTAILAIVFAALSRQGKPMSGQALGGMSCGIASLVITVVALVALITFTVNSDTDTIIDTYEDIYEDVYGEAAFEDESDPFSDMLE